MSWEMLPTIQEFIRKLTMPIKIISIGLIAFLLWYPESEKIWRNAWEQLN